MRFSDTMAELFEGERRLMQRLDRIESDLNSATNVKKAWSPAIRLTQSDMEPLGNKTLMLGVIQSWHDHIRWRVSPAGLAVAGGVLLLGLLALLL